MDFDTRENRKTLILDFPNLRLDDRFRINSPRTSVYNCIAFALGLTDRWVDPSVNIPGHWWPPLQQSDPYSDKSLIEVFEFFGFTECEDNNIEDGYDKVALFGNDDVWKHAAKIVDENLEHSKFGNCWDAYHKPESVFGPVYGYIYTYMKRKVSDRLISKEITSKEGSVQIISMPTLDFTLVG